jgi:hypothetical protein
MISNPQKFKMIPIVIILIGIFLVKSETSENVLDEDYIKDINSLEVKFLIKETHPDSGADNKDYIFSIFSKENMDSKLEKEVENEFLFKIENYQKDDPVTIDLNDGSEDDKNLVDLSNEKEIKAHSVVFNQNMIETIKLKNDFVSVELDISKNDCLALFPYIDSQKENKVKVSKDQTKVYFDFRENRINGFDSSVESYLGNSQGKYDFIHNPLHENKQVKFVFLKIVCPYYSLHAHDEIEMTISVNKRTELTDSKILLFAY